MYIIKCWGRSFCEGLQEKVGARVEKLWQMSAARWQEGSSSGHRPEAERFM